ncbi:MAG TPA: hypothetical protein VEF04_10180, partial [Blastocatellia bacterium]|nr:hypothetical protein [Blastocatellia bacterium]
VVETEAPQPASPQQEMAAIVALQKIHQCQMVFKAENQRFGTLRELAESNCLEMEYATTPVDNYLFYDAKPSEESYCIRAEPLQGTAEAKYFSVTQSGIVRVKSGEINVAVCGEGEPILNPQ